MIMVYLGGFSTKIMFPTPSRVEPHFFINFWLFSNEMENVIGPSRIREIVAPQ